MVPFVYFTSICRSLQCLISTLTQWAEVVSSLGSVVQWCCGEGGAVQTTITGMCGEYSQCSNHTGFAPAHGVCAFPVYTAQVQSALQRVCPELRSLPRPKPLRFRFLGTAQRPRLGWACGLCLPRLSSSDNQELEETTRSLRSSSDNSPRIQ